jgi:hypothetical protein
MFASRDGAVHVEQLEAEGFEPVDEAVQGGLIGEVTYQDGYRRARYQLGYPGR